ncbi:Integral membrane protein OS=Streptomyces glaucescens OX=1907 GN=SGLAU_19345 PE=4 SV=1 [Streptomyces glaucescens]
MNPAATPEPPDPGAAAHPTHVMTAEERAEYERLRRHAAVRHRRLRRAGSSVLLLMALLLAPLAVVAAWVQDTVSDTDRYVETVAPLASEPAVQDVVINRLTDRVVDNVDVAAVTDWLAKTLQDAGAPPRVVEGAKALEPLRNAVRTVVDRTVTRVITSDVFQQVWEGANRRSHAAVVNMLTGDRQGALRAEGGAVQLNLGEVVDQVRQRLVDEGFDKAAAIPDTDRTITLFESEELGKAQDAMRLLDILGTWLPVLTIVLAALAVWTNPAHRVMLVVTAVGVGLMMILLLVALAVVRRVYLDSVPPRRCPPTRRRPSTTPSSASCATAPAPCWSSR